MPDQQNSLYYKNAYLYFLIALLIAFAGFFPSYFGKLSETGAAHHFHGITATLWMLILVVQPLLYRFDKIDIHRWIGRSTIILVPLLIFGGLIMVHLMVIQHITMHFAASWEWWRGVMDLYGSISFG